MQKEVLINYVQSKVPLRPKALQVQRRAAHPTNTRMSRHSLRQAKEVSTNPNLSGGMHDHLDQALAWGQVQLTISHGINYSSFICLFYRKNETRKRGLEFSNNLDPLPTETKD